MKRRPHLRSYAKNLDFQLPPLAPQPCFPRIRLGHQAGRRIVDGGFSAVVRLVVTVGGPFSWRVDDGVELAHLTGCARATETGLSRDPMNGGSNGELDLEFAYSPSARPPQRQNSAPATSLQRRGGTDASLSYIADALPSSQNLEYTRLTKPRLPEPDLVCCHRMSLHQMIKGTWRNAFRLSHYPDNRRGRHDRADVVDVVPHCNTAETPSPQHDVHGLLSVRAWRSQLQAANNIVQIPHLE